MMRPSWACFPVAAWLVVTSLLGVAALPAQSGVPRVLAWEETLPESDTLEIRWPVAVATSPGGEIAVADAHGPMLSVFRQVGVSWQLLATAALPATPVALAWSGDRLVAALREGEGLVAFAGPDLELQRLPLPIGLVPLALAARPDGGLWVYDAHGGRVVALGADGAVGVSVPLAERVGGLASTATGGFLATVPEAAAVLRYDENGERDARWLVPGDDPEPAWPVAVTVDRGGRAVVVDSHGSRIVVLDTEGRAVGLGSRRGWEPGLLFSPGAIALLPDGRVVVGDAGNGRVQIFRPTDRGAEP
jgi:NHL repeat